MNWALTLCLLLASSGVSAQEARLFEFEMEDQFDRTYRSSDYEGRVLYVVGGDRGGSQFNGLWARAISEALEQEHGVGKLASFGVADLGGVPFFLKGMIKGKFPQEKDKWVLMDWKGRFAKAYDFEAQSSNTLVFANDGRLVHQAHGREVDQEVLDGIVAKLRALLVKAPSPEDR